jgi:WD40 repeat protein
MRLGTIGYRLPHVAGVAFRPSGELVAFSRDLALHVWSADGSHRPNVIRLAEEGRYSWPAALSADARFAAGMLDRRLVVWNVSVEKPVEHLAREARNIYRMAFAPNGTYLAINEARDREGSVLICNLTTKTWTELPIARTYVESLSFTRDGKLLTVVTGQDVLVIEAATAKERCRVNVPKINIAFAALSPDGTTLAVQPMTFIHRSVPIVRFFSIPSGEEIAWPKTPSGSGRWTGFAPDGKTVMVGSPREVREWNPMTGEAVREIAGPAAHPVVYSADGRKLASHSEHAILFWDVAKGQYMRPDLANAGHTEAIMGITLSPDGKLVATSATNDEVRLWATDSGRPLCRVRATWGIKRRVAFLPDSRSFITVAEDWVTPVVRDAVTGRELRRFTVPPEAARTETIHDLALSADSRTLITLSQPVNASGKSFRVQWDAGTGQPLSRSEQADNLLREDVTRSATSADGQWRVQGGQVSRVGSQESIQLVPAGETALLIPRFSDDSRLVGVPRMPRTAMIEQLDQGSVVVFDVRSSRRIAELPAGHVYRHAFSPDSRLLATVGRKEIALWELFTGKPALRYLLQQGNTNRTWAIEFTPDGRRLITGHEDCTALVWDLTGTGRLAGASSPRLSANDLAQAWAALAGDDVERAHLASWELSDRPTQAIDLLRDRLKPDNAAEESTVREFLAKLDSPAFATRESAEKSLRELGHTAVPALRAALKTVPSLEQKVRIERLLDQCTVSTPATRLRSLRAIAVLERIKSADARKLLDKLASGLPGTKVTREATDAVERQTARTQSK